MNYAWNVAVNRERAGLHYRSDTLAGQELAGVLFERLPRLPQFRRLMADAKAEWP